MVFDPNFNLTDPTGGNQTPSLDGSSGPASAGSSGSFGSNIANIAGPGPGLALGIGAYDIFKGDPNSAPVNALTSEAGQLGALGTQLTGEGQGLQTYLEQ